MFESFGVISFFNNLSPPLRFPFLSPHTSCFPSHTSHVTSSTKLKTHRYTSVADQYFACRHNAAPFLQSFHCFAECFAMVAVTGLMTTDTLYFHFTISELDSGSVFQAARTYFLLKQSLQYWHISKKVFFTLNFGNDYILSL